MNALFIFLLSICASFIQRTIGFGFGMFIMTMLPMMMSSYGESTALSGMLALTTSLLTMVKMWKYISWKRMVGILIPFVIVSTAAIFLLNGFEDILLKRILGVTLILTSIYFTFFKNRIQLKPTWGVQTGAGILSGLLGGFFGMQGPPAVLYFVASEPDKNHYIAMTQAYFVAGNLLMTFARGANGFVTHEVWEGYLYGLGGVVVGAAIGAAVFRRIPGKILSILVYAYIGLSGIIALLTAAS